MTMCTFTFYPNDPVTRNLPLTDRQTDNQIDRYCIDPEGHLDCVHDESLTLMDVMCWKCL